MVKLRKHINF